MLRLAVVIYLLLKNGAAFAERCEQKPLRRVTDYYRLCFLRFIPTTNAVAAITIIIEIMPLPPSVEEHPLTISSTVLSLTANVLRTVPPAVVRVITCSPEASSSRTSAFTVSLPFS